MTTSNDDDLQLLADLLRARNANEVEITRIIDRPAQLGHIGEDIASRISDIALERSAVHPGSDGRFRSGPFAGKSVNIKMYGKREGLLDTNPCYVLDCYLVLTGPMDTAMNSRGATRPWSVNEAFLFEAGPLIGRLRGRGIKLGTAASVRKEEWEAARIWPVSPGCIIGVHEGPAGRPSPVRAIRPVGSASVQDSARQCRFVPTSIRAAGRRQAASFDSDLDPHSPTPLRARTCTCSWKPLGARVWSNWRFCIHRRALPGAEGVGTVLVSVRTSRCGVDERRQFDPRNSNPGATTRSHTARSRPGKDSKSPVAPQILFGSPAARMQGRRGSS